MSKDLNRITLTGRLGADPEVRYMNDGTVLATFRVASSRSYTGADGNLVDETEWFRVSAWSKLAEVCGEYLHKGSRVFVEGRLKTRSWQDRGGQTRSMTEVVLTDLIILAARGETGRSALGSPTCRAGNAAPGPRA